MDIIYANKIYTADGVLKNAFMGIEKGKIAYLGNKKPKGQGKYYDFSNYDVYPALADIHTHGAAGTDTNSALSDDFIKLAKYNAKSGLCAFMPTAVTDSYENIERILKEVKKAMDIQKNSDEFLGAEILGLFLEGIFINPLKKGSHKEKYIKPIDLEFIEYISLKYKGVLKRMIIAPELKNSAKAAKILKNNGVCVCIGHSTANYDESVSAINSGADTAVHIFNAMGRFDHRKTGILTAALLEDIYGEIICDFVHTDKNAVRLLLRCKGIDKIVLVTDSVCVKGLKDGRGKLGELDIFIRENKAALKDGTIAGGISNVIDGVKNLISLGVSKESAFKAGSLNPLRAVGISEGRGEIRLKNKADFIVCGNELNIEKVFISGKEIC